MHCAIFLPVILTVNLGTRAYMKYIDICSNKAYLLVPPSSPIKKLMQSSVNIFGNPILKKTFIYLNYDFKGTYFTHMTDI